MTPRRRFSAVAAAAILAAAPLTALSASPAQAASCSVSNHTRGDVDGDGISDLAVGVPFFDGGKGAVDLSLSSGGRVFIQPQLYGLPASTPETFFGHSVLLEDIDHNGCADVLIGAPGFGGGHGKVFRFTSAAGTLTYRGASTGSAGSEMGMSLAALHGNRIAIGQPGLSVGPLSQVGGVTVQQFTAAGDLFSSAGLHQDSAGVPGVSEAGDRFGQVLTGNGNTLVVGTPEEAVGAQAAAGSVTLLTFGASGLGLLSARGITQDSPAVPGIAEAGDRFGYSLAAQDNRILIGVPGESIGADTRTGMVQPGLFLADTNSYTPWPAIHQDVAGVAGVNEDNDLFGWSVAVGLNTFNGVTAIIGAPGEAVGSLGNAGAVTFVKIRSTTGTMSSVGVTENSAGVPDVAQVGDRFGHSVTIRPGNLDDGEAFVDRVAIGAPGENIGSLDDVGGVFISPDYNGPWNMLLFETTGLPDLPEEAMFGSHLGSAGMNP